MVTLISLFKLLLLLIFLMVKSKHFLMCLFINHWLFNWGTSSELGGLDDDSDDPVPVEDLFDDPAIL